MHMGGSEQRCDAPPLLSLPFTLSPPSLPTPCPLWPSPSLPRTHQVDAVLHFCESIIAYFVDADAEKDTDKVSPRT